MGKKFVGAAMDAVLRRVKARRSSMCAMVRQGPKIATPKSGRCGPGEGAGKFRRCSRYTALGDDPIENSQSLHRFDAVRDAPTPARKRARIQRRGASDDDSDGLPSPKRPSLSHQLLAP